MEVRSPIPPPPKLIAIITAGFDLVANRLFLILPPLALDMFLWFGPHLRLRRLISPLAENLPILSLPGGPSSEEVSVVRQALLEFLDRFNLFSLLRTFPVGVTSMMFGKMPVETPNGPSTALDIPSWPMLVGGIFLLTLLGWFIGNLYFSWLAVTSLHLREWSLWRNFTQTALLSLIWWFFALIMGLPALFMLSLLTVINPLLGQGVIFLISLFALWLALPVFFSPHGIYSEGKNALASIMKSLFMVRYTLPGSTLFVAMAFIISEGTSYLWQVPAESSWWLLVGIAGHAFVTTSLLVASFLYYRETNVWLQAVIERLGAQATSNGV